MADERTLDDLLPTEGASDFQIEIASLSADAQEQALDAVRDAAADGTLADLDLDQVVTHARDASEARETAEDLQVEQAKAAADGDYAKAEELSTRAEYELQEVAEKGDTPVETADAIRDADHDQLDLQEADIHQDIAHVDVEAAADAAQAGDFDHADALMDHAADHAETAGDYGHNNETVEQAETHDAYDHAAE